MRSSWSKKRESQNLKPLHFDVRILFARKWIAKIFDVKHGNGKLMLIKLLIGKHVESWLVMLRINSMKIWSSFFSKLVEMSWSWLADFNKHFGKDVSGYGIYRGLGFGVRNLERVRMLEVGSPLDMAVCDRFFKKRDSQLIKYTFRPFQTQIFALW